MFGESDAGYKSESMLFFIAPDREEDGAALAFIFSMRARILSICCFD